MGKMYSLWARTLADTTLTEQGIWCFLKCVFRSTTQTDVLSFWRNFHPQLHRTLSLWQRSVQPGMKISSKMHFHFSVCDFTEPIWLDSIIQNGQRDIARTLGTSIVDLPMFYSWLNGWLTTSHARPNYGPIMIPPFIDCFVVRPSGVVKPYHDNWIRKHIIKWYLITACSHVWRFIEIYGRLGHVEWWLCQTGYWHKVTTLPLGWYKESIYGKRFCKCIVLNAGKREMSWCQFYCQWWLHRLLLYM